MTNRRASTTLATIALAIAATLCASDASACTATKDARPKGCCARKAEPACGCCKVGKTAAADPTSSTPVATLAPAADAPSCECRGDEPAVPVERPQPPPRAESPEASASDVAAFLDDRLAATPPRPLAAQGATARSPIYLRTSRLLF
ncbi:MAG: hypothetical protein BGO49_11415 [Planctomycetales bacterium 71-10]|nr:MAG: hypothetical protein BGO49_11415 [Planctomycetales bacterium 71-10]